MASLVVSFMITFIVQAFFCIRIWRFSHKNWIVTGVIATAALGQIGGGTAYAVASITYRSPQGISNHAPLLAFKIGLISSLLCDVMISGSLIYYFHTNKGQHMKMETILRKLIVFSVNQGVLLVIITIITLVFLSTPKATISSMLPSQFVLSKLYVNCLLAALNSRKEYREIADEDISLSLSSQFTHSRINPIPQG